MPPALTQQLNNKENEFELLWGLAPKGTLKDRKGKDIKSFLRTAQIEAFEAGINYQKANK